MPFAQLVIGPPGAGKSTYCNGMQQFMGAIGRKCSVVNLDPANDMTSYDAAVDVRELVTLESIMGDDSQNQNKGDNEEEDGDEAPGLGPNGGVLYALEEVEQNFDWLHDRLKDLGDDYVLFDCPGQVELFTHHDSLRKIFMKLAKEAGYRVRCSTTVVSVCFGRLELTVFLFEARRRQPRRLILLDITIPLRVDFIALSPEHATTGHDATERPDQDR